MILDLICSFYVCPLSLFTKGLLVSVFGMSCDQMYKHEYKCAFATLQV